MLLTIKDETLTGKVIQEWQLQVAQESVTIKDIITQRVEQEVESYNQKSNNLFHGLVEPKDAEVTLNGYKLKNKKHIDAEKQVYVALDAFNKNGYFVLVDNVQAEELDQVVKVSPETVISFVKLTPLVGG